MAKSVLENRHLIGDIGSPKLRGGVEGVLSMNILNYMLDCQQAPCQSAQKTCTRQSLEPAITFPEIIRTDPNEWKGGCCLAELFTVQVIG